MKHIGQTKVAKNKECKKKKKNTKGVCHVGNRERQSFESEQKAVDDRHSGRGGRKEGIGASLSGERPRRQSIACLLEANRTIRYLHGWTFAFITGRRGGSAPQNGRAEPSRDSRIRHAAPFLWHDTCAMHPSLRVDIAYEAIRARACYPIFLCFRRGSQTSLVIDSLLYYDKVEGLHDCKSCFANLRETVVF